MCNFVCDKDVDDIKNDMGRCEEFVQLCAALKTFVSDRVNLPDSSTLFEIFGKVGAVMSLMFIIGSDRRKHAHLNTR